MLSSLFLAAAIGATAAGAAQAAGPEQERVRCGAFVGTFDSSRAEDPTDLLLTGPAEKDAIYHCAASHDAARLYERCKNIERGEDEGTDRCRKDNEVGGLLFAPSD
ncbi:hypothetical protein [Streptomyces clavifer]|uniref:hypothetical protein n=1 Tax=Streptomyces clavifer TaxID=68188 RepID=UPI0038298AA7